MFFYFFLWPWGPEITILATFLVVAIHFMNCNVSGNCSARSWIFQILNSCFANSLLSSLTRKSTLSLKFHTVSHHDVSNRVWNKKKKGVSSHYPREGLSRVFASLEINRTFHYTFPFTLISNKSCMTSFAEMWVLFEARITNSDPVLKSELNYYHYLRAMYAIPYLAFIFSIQCILFFSFCLIL